MAQGGGEKGHFVLFGQQAFFVVETSTGGHGATKHIVVACGGVVVALLVVANAVADQAEVFVLLAVRATPFPWKNGRTVVEEQWWMTGKEHECIVLRTIEVLLKYH
jgi:hypothetical protein